jgi:hypothetical protein
MKVALMAKVQCRLPDRQSIVHPSFFAFLVPSPRVIAAVLHMSSLGMAKAVQGVIDVG